MCHYQRVVALPGSTPFIQVREVMVNPTTNLSMIMDVITCYNIIQVFILLSTKKMIIILL